MSGRQTITTYDAIYAAVRRIPHGKVSSYGRIAVLAGFAGQARLVGYALHALRTHSAGAGEVPWWRVINAAGYISNDYEPELQRALLEAEGICFNERGRVDFARFLWEAETDMSGGGAG